MIKVNNVCKSYKGNVVLDNISLELKEGNIYGITGRNGCGKSVLFKVICGFERPEKGNVIVLGEDIYATDSYPKDTAALIEHPRFLTHYSGYENLKMLASIQNKIGDKQILETLEKVGLFEEKDKLFKDYSIGMKEKLGIAQALMEDNKIIILDEPFSGLDDKSVLNIRNILKEEKSKGKLILISSHIKEDIEVLCDIILRIDNGKIYEIDKKEI